jgi:hypothetical protein
MLESDTEIVSLRLPMGTRDKLRLFACQQSIDQQRDVRWTTIVREALEAILSRAREGGPLPCKTIALQEVTP